MKLVTIFTFAFIFLFSSCSDDNSPSPNNNNNGSGGSINPSSAIIGTWDNMELYHIEGKSNNVICNEYIGQSISVNFITFYTNGTCDGHYGPGTWNYDNITNEIKISNLPTNQKLFFNRSQLPYPWQSHIPPSPQFTPAIYWTYDISILNNQVTTCQYYLFLQNRLKKQ